MTSIHFAKDIVNDGLNGVLVINVYAGAERMTGKERLAYGEALMATADEEWMRKRIRARGIGSERFANQLKMGEGRFRRRRGRPVKSV